jgi:endonuclease G, mitochondrial
MEKSTKSLMKFVFIVAFIAGIAFEYAFLTYLWPQRTALYTWVYTFRNYRQYGEPCKTDLVLNRKGYSLGYSYEHRAALWTAYIISTGSTQVDFERSSNFYADTDVPAEYRAKPEDFANTGYDKGHQAPSASIDFSAQANRETFALSNITLQEPKLNRQVWGKLEDLEREWTKTKGELYIITGPIFDAKPKKVNEISVPAKYYKVIYAKTAKQAIGFILPNRPVNNSDLWKFAMSVKDVEDATGLTFFSKMSASDQQNLKTNVDLDWWKGSQK